MNNETEQWKTIKDFPNYKVSNMGRIMRAISGSGTYSGRILKLLYDKYGYQYVFLWSKNVGYSRKVHRLVLMTFNPIDDKKEVNHKNGTKDDNRLNNLEWVTTSENMIHRYKILGVKLPSRIGEKNGRAKLKEKEVLLIKKILHYKKLGCINILNKDIAKMFNVSKCAIDDISQNKRWSHIQYL